MKQVSKWIRWRTLEGDQGKQQKLDWSYQACRSKDGQWSVEEPWQDSSSEDKPAAVENGDLYVSRLTLHSILLFTFICFLIGSEEREGGLWPEKARALRWLFRDKSFSGPNLASNSSLVSNCGFAHPTANSLLIINISTHGLKSSLLYINFSSPPYP